MWGQDPGLGASPSLLYLLGHPWPALWAGLLPLTYPHNLNGPATSLLRPNRPFYFILSSRTSCGLCVTYKNNVFSRARKLLNTKAKELTEDYVWINSSLAQKAVHYFSVRVFVVFFPLITGQH